MLSVTHTLYFVEYMPAGRKKPLKSRFQMTAEDAAERYKEIPYKLLDWGKTEVPAGLDVYANSTSAFLRNSK